MKETTYTDLRGRRWLVKLPEDMPESDANMGIPIGPPSLAELNLPEEIEIALHNQLYSRKIFTAMDVRRKRQDVAAAIAGALKLGTERILELYLKSEFSDNGKVEGKL